MLFLVPDFDFTRDGERIASALRSRDPEVHVAPAGAPGNLRVVARLDARRMIAAIAEAGFAAVPEWQLVA